MRTTHSFVFEEVLSLSVGVEARSWNIVLASKVALLLATASCFDESLGMIGLHGLLGRDDLELEADANSSFLALDIALAMLSWSSTRSRNGEDVLEGPLMDRAERVDFGAEKADVRNVGGGYFNLPRHVVERE